MNGIHLRYKDLTTLGACEQRFKFKKLFGDKVLATVTTAVAHAREFDWFWIAEMALESGGYERMRERVSVAVGHNGDLCCCEVCDPGGAKSRFIAQCFAEAFIAQGGMLTRRKAL